MKIFKNRLVIGCICIVAAFAIGFLAVPFLTDRLNDKVAVVIVAEDIPKGAEVSADKLRTIQMSLGDIPYADNEYFNCIDASNGNQTHNRILLKDAANVARKVYALTDMKTNDIITNRKVSTSFPYSDENLRALEDNEYAVTVSVNSLAASLGAKIQVGDIVTVLVSSEDSTYAEVPQELMYVELMSIENSDAADINRGSDGAETGIPSVVTFRANLYQAQTLAWLEQNASIHLALVCRGNDERAAELLEKQEKYFTDNGLTYRGEWFYMN